MKRPFHCCPIPRACLLILLALPVFCATVRAQVILSDFNSSLDGWQAYAFADPNTTVVYSANGGVGGTGAAILDEPANGANDYFVAAPKFTGDLSAYYGGTLSLDMKLNPAWDGSGEAAMVILTGTYNSSPLSIGYLPPTNQDPNAVSFTSYTFDLDTDTPWSLTTLSDFTSSTIATSAQIQSVLGSVTMMRVLGDWTDVQDHDILDNVQLTAAVPEPSSIVLSGLAGAAAICLHRRRRGEK